MYIAKTEPLSDFALALSRRLPWDHQIARKIDLEGHKEKMKGNFYTILSKAQIKQVKDFFFSDLPCELCTHFSPPFFPCYGFDQSDYPLSLLPDM